MANQPSNPENSAIQMVITVLAALITLTAISLLLVYILNGLKDFTSEADKATDDIAVAERIKPVAQVEVAQSGAASGGAINGEQIVNTSCAACHGTGALNSPKIGDKAAWGPRIAKGYKTLIDHAINGFNMMPARGGNPDLSDAEVAHAVAFMANKAGANFTPPKAEAN
ncbi:MAG TPA: c-type cytochrome [Methylophilaceae bacterium]|nr:c-type cytochrome [Methylophilaceae bacterium]